MFKLLILLLCGELSAGVRMARTKPAAKVTPRFVTSPGALPAPPPMETIEVTDSLPVDGDGDDYETTYVGPSLPYFAPIPPGDPPEDADDVEAETVNDLDLADPPEAETVDDLADPPEDEQPVVASQHSDVERIMAEFNLHGPLAPAANGSAASSSDALPPMAGTRDWMRLVIQDCTKRKEMAMEISAKFSAAMAQLAQMMQMEIDSLEIELLRLPAHSADSAGTGPSGPSADEPSAAARDSGDSRVRTRSRSRSKSAN